MPRMTSFWRESAGDEEAVHVVDVVGGDEVEREEGDGRRRP